MADNNQQAGKIKTEELIMPGFGSNNLAFDPLKYRVRYLRVDFAEAGDVAQLEEVETRGLAGKEVVIMSKEKYTFMDKFFFIVCYLERRDI